MVRAGRHDRHRRAAGVRRRPPVTWRRTRAVPRWSALTATFGVTCTRARPSGSSQSRRIAGGISAAVTGRGRQRRAQPVELGGQEAGQRCVGRHHHRIGRRRPAGAGRRRWHASGLSGRSLRQRRIDLRQRGLAPPAGSVRRSPAPTGDSGSKVGARIAAASAIIASFCFWSSGTKLAMLRSRWRRSAAAPDAPPAPLRRLTFGAMMSMVYGLVSGEPIRSLQRAHRLGVRVLGVQRVGIEAEARRQHRAAPARSAREARQHRPAPARGSADRAAPPRRSRPPPLRRAGGTA